jgi:hypothetical protein
MVTCSLKSNVQQNSLHKIGQKDSRRRTCGFQVAAKQRTELERIVKRKRAALAEELEAIGQEGLEQRITEAITLPARRKMPLAHLFQENMPHVCPTSGYCCGIVPSHCCYVINRRILFRHRCGAMSPIPVKFSA